MEKELQKRILSSIIIIPLSFFFIIKGSEFFILFITILFLIACLEWFKMTKKYDLKIFGIFFLLLSFYSVYLIRERSFFEFLMIFIICITTDIGGYIFGKIFKGPKLIKISPNKTYSGVFGAFLMSTIIAYMIDINFRGYFLENQIFLNDLYFLFAVFLVSSVSQIGDLIISFFKRSSNIKDTGNLFPGHGGLLDRIDGMIFAFPFVFIISKIL
ncbi:phosphatidate cytidylyltransferase [Pelagibacterales bacterium SAG-MED38]|nr:phosphatidate cytidylyltransferase [Pelagibacterales bacterium SAG-MED38]|tara:strand:- start:3676 stop:4317 length:642 start_codon:yes stop_codon:yes gene_type:complete